MPVALPAGGDLAARVTQIAAITRKRKDNSPRHVSGDTGTAVPAAGPHRAAPLVHQPPAADPHLRHQPARPGRAAHVRRCPGAGGDPHPEYHRQRDHRLRRAVLRRDTADHRAVRSQPGARRGRADGRPAPGPEQHGPLTGAADGRLPPAFVEAEHAYAAHAHIVSIWTRPLALHSAPALVQIGGSARVISGFPFTQRVAGDQRQRPVVAPVRMRSGEPEASRAGGQVLSKQGPSPWRAGVVAGLGWWRDWRAVCGKRAR
jgi:hypothetical protein